MERINELYRLKFGQNPDSIEEILCSVSNRKYFRLCSDNETIIGTYSPDVRETLAFTTFANHFHDKGLNVPQIISISNDLLFYLQSDLGDKRMHEIIVSRDSKELRDSDMTIYKSAINQLVRFQFEAYEGLDFSISVPRPAFDQQSIMWDLNHFKYYFLKPLGISFDENLLEESFKEYSNYVAHLPNENFMIRDFQTRNIIMHEGEPYFIDFQGGRKGPVQYDLASLVFEAKTGLLEKDRNELIGHYISAVAKYRKLDQSEFMKDFYAVALIRILQVLGTYGLRGLVEKKVVFIQSIPGGLKNLSYILQKIGNKLLSESFKTLLEKVAESGAFFRSQPEKYKGLTIQITSFSYRKPLPDDLSGNGGGFVYDCRFLNNPGLQDYLKNLNGLEDEVKEFLKERSDADEFIERVKDQLQAVISSYRSRNYTNLMVSFGCTGGRHRSVYVARAIADWCRQKKGIRVFEVHREIGMEF